MRGTQVLSRSGASVFSSVRRAAPGFIDSQVRVRLAAGGAMAIAAVAAAWAGAVPATAAALVVFGGAAIAAWDRPDHAFLAWFALAPFLQSVARHTEQPWQTALKEGLYFAAPLLFGLWIAQQEWTAPQRKRIIDALPLLFIALALGSISLGAERYGTYSRVDLVQQLYISVVVGVAAYFFLAFGPIPATLWQRVTAVYLVTSIVVSLMSIVERPTGWNLWNYTVWQQKDVPRMTGPLFNPAALGTYLGAAIVLALSVLVWASGRPIRRLALAALVLAAPALVLTFERASLIAAATATLAVLFLSGRTRAPVLLAVVVAGVGLAAAWPTIRDSHIYKERFAAETTVRTRRELAEWSLRLAAERPLVGWGYGSFEYVKDTKLLLGVRHTQTTGFSVPALVLDEQKGWIALRVRIDWSSTKAPNAGPTFFSWRGAGGAQMILAWFPSLHRFLFARGGSSAYDVAESQRMRFPSGSIHTLVARWTERSIGISVDGSPFDEARSNRVGFSLSTTTFDLGRQAAHLGTAHAAFLWVEVGRKQINDGDATRLARMRNARTGLRSGAPLVFGLFASSHNTFLTVLCELGVVGIVLLVTPWTLLLFYALRPAIRKSENSWLLAGWMGVLLVYVVNASFVDMRFFSLIPALPWIAAGFMRRAVARRDAMEN